MPRGQGEYVRVYRIPNEEKQLRRFNYCGGPIMQEEEDQDQSRFTAQLNRLDNGTTG